MAEILGSLWFKTHRFRRVIAEENIKLALNYGPKEASILAHRNFVHLARVFLEFAMLPKINEKNVRDLVTIEGESNFTNHQGSRICFMSGHIGNWELMAYVSSLLSGHPVTIVVRKQKPLWFNNLLERIRTKTGNRLIDKNQAFVSISKSIKNGQVVGFLIDQKATAREGIYTKFLAHVQK